MHSLMVLLNQHLRLERPYFKSRAPWKKAMNMNDFNYLPAIPIFYLASHQVGSRNITLFTDALSFFPSNEKEEFRVANILHELNDKINISENFAKLENQCINLNHAQSCLILGRIYQFGSYNTHEDYNKSMYYYEIAAGLNDTAALSQLAFYHYSEGNIAQAIAEFDITENYLESALFAAQQHIYGQNRPKSCPSAQYHLQRFSFQFLNMYNIILSQPQSRFEGFNITSINDTTVASELYDYGMQLLSMPYPCQTELMKSKEALQKAYDMEYIQAAAPLSYFYLTNATGTLNKAEAIKILQKGIDTKDPASYFLMYIHLASNITNINFWQMLSLVKKAAKDNYAPALYELGRLNYLGIMGLPRSAREGFKYWNNAAALGHYESIFLASRALLGGDGADVDCERSAEMLRRLLDLGPWSTIYDKYVQADSASAFRRMLDLGLTPSKTVAGADTNINSMETEYYSNLRRARVGNGSAIVWLALRTPLVEAEGYLDRMTSLERSVSLLEPPLRVFITIREVYRWAKGDISEADKLVLIRWLTPLRIIPFIVAGFIVLMMLISHRLDLFLN